MNNKQKVSLLVGSFNATTFLIFIYSTRVGEPKTYPNWAEEYIYSYYPFGEWYQILTFALSITSIIAFFLFKD